LLLPPLPAFPACRLCLAITRASPRSCRSPRTALLLVPFFFFFFFFFFLICFSRVATALASSSRTSSRQISPRASLSLSLSLARSDGGAACGHAPPAAPREDPQLRPRPHALQGVLASRMQKAPATTLDNRAPLRECLMCFAPRALASHVSVLMSVLMGGALNPDHFIR